MGPVNTPRRSYVYVYRYSGLGCLFAAAVILFMAGGWLLDRWIGVLPLFTVIGALLGATLATLSIYRRLAEGLGSDEDEGPGEGS
jgi:F0F1-type ATP synthase assembly protein I